MIIKQGRISPEGSTISGDQIFRVQRERSYETLTRARHLGRISPTAVQKANDRIRD